MELGLRFAQLEWGTLGGSGKGTFSCWSAGWMLAGLSNTMGYVTTGRPPHQAQTQSAGQESPSKLPSNMSKPQFTSMCKPSLSLVTDGDSEVLSLTETIIK
jgi:hypothetical protein